jgi:glycosyltransferase involved in cell wall biosynthesis
MDGDAALPRALARLGLSHHALKAGGGFERYAVTLVRGLHVQGLKPTFIAREFDVRMPEVRWVEPVRVRMTGVPHGMRDHVFDWRIGALKRRLKLAPLNSCNPTRHADIAVCGGTHPGYLAAMGMRPGLHDRWKIALERAFYARADVIVAHSRAMKDEIAVHYGISGQKVQLLYPPVDGTRFHPPASAEERRALRRRFDLPDDRAVFLLASTSHRRKGLGRLTAYFANTDLPATLVVAGRPLGGSPGNVRWVGYCRDIENLYRAVDFTILASTYEPFGLVGIESLLCGTPVLIGAGVGCGEVIDADARIDFGLDHELGEAVRKAVAQWRTDTHRIDVPARALRYDPSVAVHIDALLALARAWEAGRADPAGAAPAAQSAHA